MQEIVLPVSTSMFNNTSSISRFTVYSAEIFDEFVFKEMFFTSSLPLLSESSLNMNFSFFMSYSDDLPLNWGHILFKCPSWLHIRHTYSLNLHVSDSCWFLHTLHSGLEYVLFYSIHYRGTSRHSLCSWCLGPYRACGRHRCAAGHLRRSLPACSSKLMHWCCRARWYTVTGSISGTVLYHSRIRLGCFHSHNEFIRPFKRDSLIFCKQFLPDSLI